MDPVRFIQVYTVRLASASDGPRAEIVHGKTGIGRRIREALGQAGTAVAKVEKSTVSQGRVFPGTVRTPPVLRGEEKDRMVEDAIGEVRRKQYDPSTLWTGGSKLDSGGV